MSTMPSTFTSSGSMPSNPGHFPFRSMLAACCSSAAVMGPVLMSSSSKAIVWGVNGSAVSAVVSSCRKCSLHCSSHSCGDFAGIQCFCECFLPLMVLITLQEAACLASAAAASTLFARLK